MVERLSYKQLVGGSIPSSGTKLGRCIRKSREWCVVLAAGDEGPTIFPVSPNGKARVRLTRDACSTQATGTIFESVIQLAENQSLKLAVEGSTPSALTILGS